jgi:xylulokinase
MEYLVGIDVGTSGTKTVLFDTEGKKIAGKMIEYPLHAPHPAWAEQDPKDWWEACKKSLRYVTSKVDTSKIRGVSLSGQMHGSVFLDRNNQVIRNCILWCDGRTHKECDEIYRRVGRAKFHRWTANPALTGFTAPKVLWLRNNEPANFRRLETLVLPKDYIRYLLTGEICMEVSDAAGTVLFDVAKREWCAPLMKALDLDMSILPPVLESQEVAGTVTKEAARATGLKEGTPVIAGGADNTCGAIGTGVVKEGRVLCSLGTSGIIFAPSGTMRRDPSLGLHSFCHSVPNVWYLMGCMLSAGMSLRWFRDRMAGEETAQAQRRKTDVYDILMEKAQTAPLGSEGLIFLPYLMGERSPHGNPHAKGVFFGLTFRHGKEHIIRAIIEGVTFGLLDSLEICRDLKVKIGEIRATGGGARSKFWLQTLADVFGKEVVTVNTEEGPALGAALLAGVGAGVYPSVIEATDQVVKVTGSFKPDRKRHSAYREQYELFHSLYPLLKDSFAEVSSLVEKQRKKR